MAYRSISVNLGLNNAEYVAGLHNSVKETRSFAAAAENAGKKAGDGFREGAVASKDYATAANRAAEATKKAETNVAALARRNTELRALATSYKQIADEAEKGSARQVAAARLVEVSNKRLGISATEAQIANVKSGAALSGTIGLLERFGGTAGAQLAVARQSYAEVGAAAGGMGSAVAAGAAVGVLAVGALVTAGVKSYTNLAAEVRNFQRASGASAEDSSRFVAVLDDLGISAETGGTAVFKLGKRVADGGIELAGYGIAVAKSKDGTSDLIGTLLNAADAYVATSDPARRAEIAFAAFGKQGQALIPVLEQGRAGLQAFFASAEGGHQILSQADIDAAREYELAVDHLGDSMRGFGIQVGRGATPVVTAFAEGLADVADWIDRNSQKGSFLERVWTNTGHALSGQMIPGLNKSKKELKDNAEEADRTRSSFAAMGVALSDAELELLRDKDTREEVAAATLKHKSAMESTAQSVGLSAAAMSRAIGFGAQVTVDDFGRQETAAKSFAAAVQSGVEASSKAFLKTVDAVSFFSASSIAANAKREASSTKAADKITGNEDRVADAVRRVADIHESHAEKAAADKEAYAAKVVAANEKIVEAEERYHDVVQTGGERVAEADERLTETVTANKERLTEADQRYADIVETENDRIAEADQRLADIRVDAAQRVQDAKDRLLENRESGQEAIRDAEQRLRDLQTRSTGGTPEQRAEAARQRDIQRAREDVEKARKRAAKTEDDDRKAVAKAERDQIESIAKAQADADDARTQSVRTIEKAELDLSKTRNEVLKSDAAAQKAADDARQDSARATLAAETAVGEARRASNKLAEEGASVGVQTRSQARELERALEAVAEAQAKTGTAGTVSAEQQAAAIKVTTEEMKEFYRESLAEGNRFADGIRGAIRKGYDPGFISRLLQQGPQEAAPILGAIASDHDNSLRDLVNASEKAIAEVNFRIREMARFTHMAAKSETDEMNRDFDSAMAVMVANSGEGGKKTAEAIARELGLGVEEVRRISLSYGITLADGLNPILNAVGATAISVENNRNRGTAGAPMAFGGTIPGYGDQDNVPILATPGEFMFSKPAVQRLGVEYLEHLHQMARSGYAPRAYATGGFVTAEDVPKPPDLSSYGDMVGYTGDKVNWYGHDAAVAYVEAHPAGYAGAAMAAPSGPVPPGQVSDWVAAGIALAEKPSAWVVPEVRIAMHESGGNPRAINNWDSNAKAGTPSKGLMQTIEPTFRAYMEPGHGDIWNPVDNVAAATNYIAARYGNPWNTPGERSLASGGPYKGYAAGGLIEAYQGYSAGVIEVYDAGIMDRGAIVPPGHFVGNNTTGAMEHLVPREYGPREYIDGTGVATRSNSMSIDYERWAQAMAGAIDYDRLARAIVNALPEQPQPVIQIDRRVLGQVVTSEQNGRARGIRR